MYGRKGRERRMKSSVAERLLGATKLPLLIVRPLSRGASIDIRVDAEYETPGATTRAQCLEAEGSVI